MKQSFINSPNRRFLTYFICFIFFYFNSPVLFGQHHTCGHDHVMKEMIKDKDAVEKYKAFEKVIYDKTINENTQYKTGVETYTIPVVVHVVHESSDDVIGTGTNIASSRVDLAIEHLNDAFNNDQNYYTNALGVNTNIRFCLEEITRTSNDTYTNINLDSGEQNSIGNAVGSWNAWSTVDYLNIWVVNEVCNDPGNDDCNGCPNNSDACNVAGYAWPAFFPSVIGTTKDGAVMEDQTFGISPQGSVVLIHEVGHYLGLYHTFEGGCATSTGNCFEDGDKVCDTPLDNTDNPAQGCTSESTCGATEMFENYMDYGNTACKDLFSEGQGTRMRFTLETARASLLATEACTFCGINAAFDYTIDVNTVHFTNNSTVGPGTVTYAWDFGDGNTSTQESPTHSYGDVGTYFVCFTISTNDNGDVCTETKHAVIEIVCPAVEPFEIMVGGAEFDGVLGANEIFTVESNNTQSIITEYSWDFGDGTVLNSSTADPVSHSYSELGIFEICLTITYSNGLFSCDEEFCLGNVEVICPLVPSFEIHVDGQLSSGVLNDGDLISISSTSTGVVSEYNWDLGDGTYLSSADNTPFTHTYQGEGFYEICLTIFYSEGATNCSETICECIRVDKPESTSPEICNNGIDDDGDGLVDCFDPDCCTEENPFCDENYYNTCPQTCQFPSFNAPFTTAVEENGNVTYNWHNYNIAITGNVDCDPQPEIIGKTGVSADNNLELYIIDGITRELEYTIPTNLPMSRANSVAIGDVDNDGKIEIIGVGGYIPTDQNPMSNQIFCYEISCNAGQISHVQKWLSPVIGYPGTGDVYSTSYPNIADFNGDGQAEVYMLNQIYDGVSGQLLTEGGAENHVGAMSNTSIGGTAIAVDILDDDFCTDCEGMELVVGGQIYSVYIDNDCGDYRMTVELEVSGPLGQDMDGHTSIVDYDNNNTLDVIVSRVEGNMAYIFVWDIASNTILSDITFPVNETFNGRFGIARVTPANYDDDPEIELAVVSANELRFIDQNAGAMTVAQTIDVADQSGGTGVVVYDFEGDGKNEIVYRDEGDLMVFQFNNGQYETVLSKPCSSGTAGEYPVVVDVDGDGETEIVCSCGIGAIYNGNGEIRVYGSNSFPWVPTRQVWNQYNYSTTNINDDLTIPAEPQLSTLIPDESFNAFPFQPSIVNAPLPDATVEAIDLFCSAGSMEVTVKVCNDHNSQNILTSTVNVSFYNGDPMGTDPDVTLLESVIMEDYQTTPTDLGIGDCFEFTVLVEDFIGDLYIVVNDNNQFVDNGSGQEEPLHPTPYLDTDGDGFPDFSYTPIAECDYKNNFYGPIKCECEPTYIDVEDLWIGDLAAENNTYGWINASNVYINQPLVIPLGNNLLIDNTKLKFGPNGSISVEGNVSPDFNEYIAIIKSDLDRECRGKWVGIKGMNVNIRISSSTISNAGTAIEGLYDNNSEFYSCGVFNSKFDNNSHSINLQTTKTNVYANYELNISESEFISGLDNDATYFVNLERLNFNEEQQFAAYIRNNTFNAINDPSNTTIAIRARHLRGGKLNVGAAPVYSTTYPDYPPNLSTNEFFGLHTGISIATTFSNLDNFNGINVVDNKFYDTKTGLYATRISHTNFSENIMNNVDTRGVVLKNPKGYIISDNELNGINNASYTNRAVLIRDALIAGGTEHIISGNTISGFDRALWFYAHEDFTDPSADIQFTCNDFINNDRAIFLSLNADIQTLTSEGDPSSNSFDGNNTDIWVHPNSSLSEFFYYICGGPCLPFEPNVVNGSVIPTQVLLTNPLECTQARVASGQEEVEPNINFEINPNPNNGQFDIVLDEPMDIDEEWTIQIYNNQGSVVEEMNGTGFVRGYLSMDLSRYPAGMYMVQLKTESTIQTKKVVVTK